MKLVERGFVETEKSRGGFVVVGVLEGQESLGRGGNSSIQTSSWSQTVSELGSASGNSAFVPLR